MIVWRYKKITPTHYGFDWWGALIDAGNEGWELATTVANGEGFFYILKRPVEYPDDGRAHRAVEYTDPEQTRRLNTLDNYTDKG
jgi:hypothetical protein